MQAKNNKFIEEIFSVVDENGTVIGKETRFKCHDGSKILHPVVHVHIMNSRNKLMLQKRRMDKDIQPGKWDTSIGGHVQFEESVDDAVIRESKEEAGIDIDLDKIKFIKKYVFETEIEKEFSYSFIYFFNGRIKFQKSEIEKIDFFTSGEIQELINNNETTPNFIKEFEMLKELKYI